MLHYYWSQIFTFISIQTVIVFCLIIYFKTVYKPMRKSSSTSSQLLYRAKLLRPLSIQRLVLPTIQIAKQNQPKQNQKGNDQIKRVNSSNRLLSRYPSITSIDQKKTYTQPNRWLIKAKVATQQEITSNKEIPKIFKRRRSVYPQSQKQIPIEQIKPIARRTNQTLKQSRIERKLIIRNPFQKRQLQIQFLQLSKCDQSAIAHNKSEMVEDVSEIKNIVTTIAQQESD